MPDNSLRIFNRGQVRQAVASDRASNRAELAELTGLARSTVTSVVAELLADGSLVETDMPVTTGRRVGRPSRRLTVPPVDDLAVAVDFGHSHCRIGVLDRRGSPVLPVEVAYFDVDSSPEQAMNHAGTVIRTFLRQLADDARPIVGAAIGLPAPVNAAAGAVGPGNVLPKWRHRRPAAELQAALGLSVRIENDANLGALAELHHGAAQGCLDIAYVKVSTGVGAGLILGGQLHRGTTGMAGEIGHVPVDHQGALCRCGNRGCLESMSSVSAVLNLLQSAHAEPMTLTRMLDYLHGDDLGTTRVITEAGRQLGRALADLVNTLNPQMIVIGGELSLAGAPLLAGVNESLQRFTQQDIMNALQVRIGSLGENTQLVGAAVLARSFHEQLPPLLPVG